MNKIQDTPADMGKDFEVVSSATRPLQYGTKYTIKTMMLPLQASHQSAITEAKTDPKVGWIYLLSKAQ